MLMTFAEFEEHARQLPPEERARLADLILESLQETPSVEIEAAWNRESRHDLPPTNVERARRTRPKRFSPRPDA